jgi:hypothetical protein
MEHDWVQSVAQDPASLTQPVNELQVRISWSESRFSCSLASNLVSCFVFAGQVEVVACVLEGAWPGQAALGLVQLLCQCRN